MRLTKDTAVHGRDAAPASASLIDQLLAPLAALEAMASSAPSADVELRRSPGVPGYRIQVDESRVVLEAATDEGFGNAVHALRQLLPPETLAEEPPRDAEWVVPRVLIEDEPRFGWRGCMIDVARHFIPIEALRRMIDLLALHRLNVLHLHLTDDQGWRVQIQRYPRLTEVGAWRRESPVGHAREGKFDGVPHGGFYTQAELRDLVDYAARRGITIVPEIDMPGHMVAAIASYPELGNYPERQLEVRTAWGISEQVLNVEDSTVRFFTEVLDEVLDIFPSPYVHLGGDECPTVEWRESARAQQRLRELGLRDEGALEGWFLSQMAAFLTSRGRRMVGWDEIVERESPADAVVMAWREQAYGVRAARMGHEVVMAPTSHLYFDYAQSPDPSEPVSIGGLTTWEDVYGFDPISPELTDASRIIGTQCQLWTEYIATPEHLEYMAFPRMSVFSEIAWNDHARDISEFRPRLAGHLSRLDALGVNYRRPTA